MATCSRRATSTTWSARCTSCATAPSTWTTTDVWDTGRSAEEVWRRYFETLGEAARSGLFDILAHPDLVKVWGARAPAARGRPAPLLRARDGRRSPSRGSRSRCRPPGCASRVGEIYPAPGVPRDVPGGRRARSRCPATRTARGRRRRLRAGAGAARRARACSELCVFERRERRLEPIGATRVSAPGSATTAHRFAAGRTLVLGGVEIATSAG